MSKARRGITGALAVAVLAASAVAATASAGTPAPVRVGSVPALPSGARSLGAPAPGTQLRVTIALAPRDPSALTAFATEVSTPGAAAFHQYLTAAQFAQRFGASGAQVATVRSWLQARGLPAGTLSPNRLSIALESTTSRLASALSTSFTRLALAHGASAIVNRAAPLLPANVAPLVQSVIGLSTLAAPRPTIEHHTRTSAAARPQVVTGGPQPCSAATAAAPSDSSYTADQIASAYGLSGLYGAGDQGAGETIALYELEPDAPSDIAAYQACYGTSTSVSYLPVDGGAGSGAGSGEAALDIEALIGLAPKASILVYQAPNSNSGAPGAGPYDLYNAIISQDRAQVISTSWGTCEADEGSTDAAAENTLFEEAAVQGESVVAASGDDGSEACYGDGSLLPNPSLAVGDPASQPFVTGVGGTTLSALGPRPRESVWNNNQGGPPIIGSETQPGAGGGGKSSFWPMPAYQSQAPASLHVVQSSVREVPDVSSDADPNTGYLSYYSGGWVGVGGTSAGAPTWAAVLALANASSTCHGSAIGFANPALYRAAASNYAGAFNDVTSGNNDFTGTNGGQYAAGAGYDLATGLGTPNAATLAATVCPDTLRLTDPGTQRSYLHARVALQLHARDLAGQTLKYDAVGLPKGLSINHVTGKISGKPSEPGIYGVAAAAIDGQNAIGHAAFAWVIAGPPTVTKASLTGGSSKHPRLSFVLTAGAYAPKLSSVRLSAPAGLHFTGAAQGVRVTTLAGKKLRFSVRLAGGKLVLKFRGGISQARITIAAPPLSGSSTAKHARFGLAAKDAAKHRTRLRVKA